MLQSCLGRNQKEGCFLLGFLLLLILTDVGDGYLFALFDGLVGVEYGFAADELHECVGYAGVVYHGE